jgi:dipeptidyl aminopeptidase/acylaminoacyl peptidase
MAARGNHLEYSYRGRIGCSRNREQSAPKFANRDCAFFIFPAGGTSCERRRPAHDRQGADGRYVPTGHLVYALGSTSLAVPFNVTKLENTGGPVPVTEGVVRAGNTSGAAQFSFAGNGTMVYFVDDVNSSDETKVALVDRDGKEKPLPFPPTRYSEPRISPDGKQAAVVSDDEQDNGFLSVYELSQTTALRRLTFQNADHPVWTRDGQRLIFDSAFDRKARSRGCTRRCPRLQRSTVRRPLSWSGSAVIVGVP